MHSLQCSYNEQDNVVSKKSGDILTSYGYDEAHRLVEVAQNGELAEHYRYDSVNNRLGSHLEDTYHHDANNQLVKVGGSSYEYDRDGNTTRKVTADGSATTFQ
ncbi:MAG: hypothetical protein GY712_03625 [Oceanicoccus sp.]|uniref:hypothetical protein n=1 Tax=Oceanicoccus sp. TaxID=2691044 RepID=UPI00262EE57B|nr:hypothetical protein [Oceanicoccus sp.]MCP3907086.1 hypothetical protein [Oceanicoccus sp.]